MAKLVSKTYGEALFELALEDNTLDSLTKEVEVFTQVLKENKELASFIGHPKVSTEDKIQMLENVCKGRFSDSFVGFLVLVIQKRRFDQMVSILDYYLGRVREYKKIGVVEVISAYALSSKQQKNIEERLLQTTKYEKLEMHYTVDNSIIGGLIIRIKDRVVDNSIKSQIKAMTKVLI